MVQITLKNKGKRISRLPKEIEFSGSESVAALKKQLSRATGLNVNRIRLTIAQEDGKKKDVALRDSDEVGDYFSTEDKVLITVKDLGPQLSWRMVYLIEYFGPLFIHPFFYYSQKLVYGREFEHTKAQELVYAMALLHFAKREFETAFIHHFSMDTMPAFNLIKNCAHYWFLSGVLLAGFCYAPQSSNLLFKQDFVPLSDNALYALSLFWVFAEVSNGITHLKLASLRNDGSRERKIPTGYGFNLVSYPNYFFETLSWVAYALIIQNWSSWVFLAVGSGQMVIWAIKKHRRYRKEFPNYPKNRKAMFPFIL